MQICRCICLCYIYLLAVLLLIMHVARQCPCCCCPCSLCCFWSRLPMLHSLCGCCMTLLLLSLRFVYFNFSVVIIIVVVLVVLPFLATTTALPMLFITDTGDRLTKMSSLNVSTFRLTTRVTVVVCSDETVPQCHLTRVMCGRNKIGLLWPTCCHLCRLMLQLRHALNTATRD